MRILLYFHNSFFLDTHSLFTKNDLITGMTEKTQFKTKNDLLKRLSSDKVIKQIEIFKGTNTLNEILNTIPVIFLVINDYRQVIYMNKTALDFAKIKDVSSIIGQRPGEVFGCIYASKGKGGCGTSEACTYCGCINVILASQEGKPAVNDCRLIIGPNEEAYVLRVWSHPIIFNNIDFYAVSLQDIGNEKRRQIFERLFFHDLLNTVNSLTLSLNLLDISKDENEKIEYIKKLNYYTRTITEQIQSQQILNAAETNNLTIASNKFNSIDFLSEMVKYYEDQLNSRQIKIQIDPKSENIEIETDKIILKRIILNIIKNAFEAINKDGKIIVGCVLIQNGVKIWVNNPGYIPREIQYQIFQRTFSTKGTNRGLGTYSMKLLSSYLNGNVTFTTSEENGTTFEVYFPIKPK